jgi:repressor LexA
MDFNERLRDTRIKRGFTQVKFAQELHISKDLYNKYERTNTKPGLDMICDMARVLGVTTDYLLGNVENLPSGKGIRIPVLGSVAAGVPIEAVQDILDYEEIDSETASQGDFFALKIKGDSMEPKMSSGDVVIVRKQSDVESGDVAVVLVNGHEGTVKKIKKRPDGIVLISTNPAFDPIFFNNEDIATLPVVILGKVVELRAKF